MGIVDGQPVNQTYTNPAFLDRRSDDTAIGKYTFANTETASGSSVLNLQAEVNSNSSFTGKALNSAYNALPSYLNNDVGALNDPLVTRLDVITGRFNSTSGHTHDGTTGNGPKILASNLANVPYRGYIIAGLNLTGVTGASINVTTEMSGYTPGGNTVTLGVVTDSPQNKTILLQASGSKQGDQFIDSDGNIIYGRLTYAALVWTLSFYVNLAGVETSYSFTSSVDIAWFFQQIFNPMVYAPTYSEFTFIPSENVTADVLTATQSAQGKVLLSSSAGAAIASAGTIGTPNATVANADHTHQGVHSISKQGSAQLFGDITLTGSSSITLTQVGQNIDISSLGSIGYQETPAGVVNGVNTTFGPLSFYPSDGNSIIVFIDSIAIQKTSWSLVGNSIVFSADIPQPGQSVYVFYLTAGVPVAPPVVSGALLVEYRTLTGGEVTAKQLTLGNTPVNAIYVVVDLVGAGAQVYSVDYVCSGSVLNWSGYGLDGVLTAGDILRIQYVT